MISVVQLNFSSCTQTSSRQNSDREGLIEQKDTCDNPDANIGCCFVDMPVRLTSTMTITGPDEAGQKIRIAGTIFKSNGVTPYADVILYAYHTDYKGYYSKKGDEKGFQKWHGRLHGWCKTDSRGTYEIHTIRPARYPDNTMPAHIHAAIKLPSGRMKYINDFVFKDDTLVDEKYLSRLSNSGGTGVLEVRKTAEGNLMGVRNIIVD